MDITTYIKNVCQHCGLDEADCQVTIDENDEKVSIQLNVPQEDVGLFIGNRGETLAALQRLVRIIFREQFAERHVVLNINDYRDSRHQQLQEKALEIAAQVLESGRSYRFQFLSSYERYLVHKTIAEDVRFGELESFSDGEGRERRLILQLKSSENAEQAIEGDSTKIETQDSEANPDTENL